MQVRRQSPGPIDGASAYYDVLVIRVALQGMGIKKGEHESSGKQGQSQNPRAGCHFEWSALATAATSAILGIGLYTNAAGREPPVMKFDAYYSRQGMPQRKAGRVTGSGRYRDGTCSGSRRRLRHGGKAGGRSGSEPAPSPLHGNTADPRAITGFRPCEH